MLSVAKSTIYFFFQAPVTLNERTRLKRFIRQIFQKEGKVLHSLNYIFCTDKDLLKVNQQYLNHDDYTDIITFQYSDKKQPVEGEIYISAERVRENAHTLQQTLKKELLRVIFHGALHLCGYKDKTPSDLKKMRAKEDLYLAKYLSTKS